MLKNKIRRLAGATGGKKQMVCANHTNHLNSQRNILIPNYFLSSVAEACLFTLAVHSMLIALFSILI